MGFLPGSVLLPLSQSFLFLSIQRPSRRGNIPAGLRMRRSDGLNPPSALPATLGYAPRPTRGERLDRSIREESMTAAVSLAGGVYGLSALALSASSLSLSRLPSRSTFRPFGPPPGRISQTLLGPYSAYRSPFSSSFHSSFIDFFIDFSMFYPVNKILEHEF